MSECKNLRDGECHSWRYCFSHGYDCAGKSRPLTIKSHDPRMDLTLKDMILEPAAIRDPFKTELSEDQKAFRAPPTQS